MTRPHFADIIPDLGTQMGISRLEYLPVAIKQAKYYGMDDVAEWFEKTYERLTRAVEEEWRVENSQSRSDCTGN